MAVDTTGGTGVAGENGNGTLEKKTLGFTKAFSLFKRCFELKNDEARVGE